MTGVGVARGDTPLGTLEIEVRSVNARGLTVKPRLSGPFQGMDAAVEAEVQKCLKRGTVQVTLTRITEGVSEDALLDRDLAARAAAELKEVAADLGLSGGVQLRDLLAVPGLFGQPSTRRSTRAEMPDEMVALLREALDGLVVSRRAEGDRTREAMLAELQEIDGLVKRARERVPAVVAAYRERLQGRMDEFLAGSGHPVDEQVLLHEVAVFADRVDVGEELQRLGAHGDALRDLLAGGGVMGRRLEFLLQETLREANTLGSKSPDVALSHLAVDLKSAIERLKEQAANLE